MEQLTQDRNDAWAEHAAQVSEAKRRLDESPGQVAWLRWQEVRRSVGVFQRNAAELLAVLNAGESDQELIPELFQNVRPPLVRDEYFARLDQRLHNTLAAAVSLVDHTRRLVNEYEGTGFAEKFGPRNEAVRSADSSVFVRDLRNYLLHYGQAPFVSHVRLSDAGTEGDLISEIRIDGPTLVRWSKWSAGSRAFIEASGAELLLTAAIRSYVDAMTDLYRWVFEQFEVLHGNDIDATNALVRELNLTMTGGASDGTDWPERVASMEAQLRDRRDREQQADSR